MSDRDLCSRILDRVGDRAQARVVVTRGPDALTRFANSFIHQNLAEDAVSVSLVVAVDGRTATVATSRTAPEALDELVDRALAAAELRPADPLWPGMAPPAPVPEVDHFDPATAEAGPELRANLVKEFVEAGGGLSAAGYCQTQGSEVTLATTGGQWCYGRSTRAVLDGIQQTPVSAGSAHQASLRVADLSGRSAGSAAARKATDGINPVDLKPGKYQVVLEPNAVATILLFLGFYGFNAKAVIEQRSFVQLGEQQFDPAVTLVDDATRPEALGLAFDWEGTPKHPLTLIEAGVPRALVHDRRTARRLEAESTGHAVPAHLIPGGGDVGAIPVNMFLNPGSDSRQEMVAGVDRGLLVTEFNYCRVLDPRTLAVTGLTRNGTFLIENGQIAGPVTNLRFTQSFVEALQPGAVLGVESQGRFGNAEFGAGFVHTPSLRLAEWNFTGGAAG